MIHPKHVRQSIRNAELSSVFATCQCGRLIPALEVCECYLCDQSGNIRAGIQGIHDTNSIRENPGKFVFAKQKPEEKETLKKSTQDYWEKRKTKYLGSTKKYKESSL